MKIQIRSASRGAFGGISEMSLEAAKIVVPGFKFATTLYATPFIDGEGRISDYWTITDSVTGGSLTGPYNTIDEAIAVLHNQWKGQHMTKGKLARVQAQTLKKLYYRSNKGRPKYSL